MRKVLSFVLMLSLVLGSFGTAFAATPPDVVGEKSEKAVNALVNMDIINGYPDGTFKPEGIVTRAELSKILVTALGLDDMVSNTWNNFTDTVGHWANGYISYASSLGIIIGYPDGSFQPDGQVTYEEAATMMVRSLGYDDRALLGTWPENYVTKAMTLGLCKDVKVVSGTANRGDIAHMIYKLLDVNDSYAVSEKWAEALKNRDGKVRYELMAPESKADYYNSLVKINGDIEYPWVIGWSSPYVVSYDIKISGASAVITYITKYQSEPDEYIYKEELFFNSQGGKTFVSKYNVVEQFGKDIGTEIKSLAGYIVIRDNTLHFKEVEIVEWEDQERVKELGLNEYDMPNGYRIIKKNKGEITFELADKVEYTFTDVNLDFIKESEVEGDRLYTTTEKNEFIGKGNDSPLSEQNIPYFIEVQDGKVISITEEFKYTI